MHLRMVHCTAITCHYKPSKFELCSFKLRRDIFATVVVNISLSELGVVSVKGVARQECKECTPTQGKIKFETSVSCTINRILSLNLKLYENCCRNGHF